ncbi:MAG TPA: class I SAM-dependent methyltransferase [Candidatus Saccharimonadales bacterium]|nr:class I SAM-dependent methyltransferase [Candidatus Saccharimonadales bacterium]
MSAIELGSVQKTLLLPLWGRAVEAKKPRPLLVDQTAADIVSAIDYDFSTIAANISVISQLSWIARSIHTDRTIREFLTRHPDATFVNLGCGLDTTFERVDNGRLVWYDLDLPDVIELRRRYIPQRDRRHSIACSLFDPAWRRQINAADWVFFVASGLFYYFEEAQIRALLIQIADSFPGSEALFDACSPRGLRIANRKVIKAGGMDENATLKWGLRRARDLEAWDSRIIVLEEYPKFRNMKRGLRIQEKCGTFISDFLGIMSMVHLRLGARPPGPD